MNADHPIEIVARTLMRAAMEDMPGYPVDRNAWRRIKDPRLQEDMVMQQPDIDQLDFLICTEMFPSTSLGFDLTPQIGGSAMTKSVTMLVWFQGTYLMYWNGRLGYRVDAKKAPPKSIHRLRDSLSIGRSWCQQMAHAEFGEAFSKA